MSFAVADSDHPCDGTSANFRTYAALGSANKWLFLCASVPRLVFMRGERMERNHVCSCLALTIKQGLKLSEVVF